MISNNNFWRLLPRPFFVLAPMADVTDPPFRSIIAKYGKPDVMFTQFVSCDGLCSDGYDVLVADLGYLEIERPIVAQFFGAKPENFYKCAKLAQKLGFDGIDINMGCPDKNVIKQGAGAALINNYKLAQEIIVATKEGAGKLPVSIKTRIGDTKNQLSTWIPFLLKTEPDAITLHARTRSQMSKVPANWEYIKDVVLLAKGSDTVIIGNGDMNSLEEAMLRSLETGVDGVMFGRAIFGNPWFFNKRVAVEQVPNSERLGVMVEHAFVFEKYFGSSKNYATMKKHFKSYTEGFSGAKDLRIKLMNTKNAGETKKVVDTFLKTI